MKLKELLPLIKSEIIVKWFDNNEYDFEFKAYALPKSTILNEKEKEIIAKVIKEIGEYKIIKIEPELNDCRDLFESDSKLYSPGTFNTVLITVKK